MKRKVEFVSAAEAIKRGYEIMSLRPICHPESGFDIIRDLRSDKLIVCCAKCERPLRWCMDSNMHSCEL